MARPSVGRLRERRGVPGGVGATPGEHDAHVRQSWPAALRFGGNSRHPPTWSMTTKPRRSMLFEAGLLSEPERGCLDRVLAAGSRRRCAPGFAMCMGEGPKAARCGCAAARRRRGAHGVGRRAAIARREVDRGAARDRVESFYFSFLQAHGRASQSRRPARLRAPVGASRGRDAVEPFNLSRTHPRGSRSSPSCLRSSQSGKCADERRVEIARLSDEVEAST